MGRDVTVLVPVRVLAGESVSPGTAATLVGSRVVVLGYHEFPEQTPVEQARDQFEPQIRNKLDDVEEILAEAGVRDVETRVAFTHDAEQTIDRVAEETASDALVLPNPTPAVESVLFVVDDVVDVARMAMVAGALLADRGVTVTVYAAADDEEERAARADVAADARERLVDAGFPADRVSVRTETAETPLRATATAGTEHDLVVMGERAPTLRSMVFGPDTEAVAELSVGPVLVVRRR